MTAPRPGGRGPRRKLRPAEADCLGRLLRDERPVDVAAALRVDKSQVSRWARKFRTLRLLPRRSIARISPC